MKKVYRFHPDQIAQIEVLLENLPGISVRDFLDFAIVSTIKAITPNPTRWLPSIQKTVQERHANILRSLKKKPQKKQPVTLQKNST